MSLLMFSSTSYESQADCANSQTQDAVMCLAMLLSATETSLIVAEMHYGGGRHVGDIPPDIYAKGMEMNVISSRSLRWALPW